MTIRSRPGHGSATAVAGIRIRSRNHARHDRWRLLLAGLPGAGPRTLNARIHAGTAVQVVVPAAAFRHVLALGALELVVASPSEKGVFPTSTLQQIVPPFRRSGR